MDLKDYRNEIDLIDEQLRELFLQRMEICREIGEYKKTNKLETLDAGRETALLEHHKLCTPKALQPYVEELFKTILDCSKKLQKESL